jgi:hypothetical protein
VETGELEKVKDNYVYAQDKSHVFFIDKDGFHRRKQD